jgi:hypothetical protein
MRRAKSAPSISTRNAAADEMFLQPRMSALGQKQTFAVQKGMSDLPLKADIEIAATLRAAHAREHK